jgi:hypothetical protein
VFSNLLSLPSVGCNALKTPLAVMLPAVRLTPGINAVAKAVPRLPAIAPTGASSAIILFLLI